VETANVAADPHRQYRVSPADHFALIKRCRETAVPGSELAGIIGVYHSHPRSAPVPSPADLREALADFLYIIVGPVGGSSPVALRAYRLIDGAFEGVTLTGRQEPPAFSRPRAR